VARVPVEVVLAGERHRAAVSSAVALCNAEQAEFVFSPADDELQLPARMHHARRVYSPDFLDRIDELRRRVRGYHPYVLTIVDSELDGRVFTNLFGSQRSDAGLAVVTTAGVPGVIVPADRLVAYFVYYLARYTLSFLAPGHRTHHETRGCAFDFKEVKQDLLQSMSSGALCDQCRTALISGDGMLSARQFAAVDGLLALAGRILADGHEQDGQARIFVGSSSEGLGIARMVQQLLSDEFSVVVWDQGTVFGLGQATLEALEAAVLEYQSGIFVFTPDDELTSRGDTRPVARDNVLFELGMFIGKLGRRRAFAIHPGAGTVTLPTDLNGITTASYRPDEPNLAAALGPPVNRIRAAVREIS
jgi:hypothetical protein